jgi:hypothetical protein
MHTMYISCKGCANMLKTLYYKLKNFIHRSQAHV